MVSLERVDATHLGPAPDGRLDDVPLPADRSPSMKDCAQPERLITLDVSASTLDGANIDWPDLDDPSGRDGIGRERIEGR